jgi:heat-inducible transcriptional repressor
VLRAIVSLHSLDGEPVGSGLLAEHFGRAVSSATLRNEMAALTKLGLLEQPHTSAGRVPSAKGYRYYIDNLLDAPTHLNPADRQRVNALFREMDYDPERLAQSAARALADWTGYTVVATTPKCEDLCIAHYEVMQVGQYTAAVLAVTNAGGVHTRTAKLDFPLQSADAERLTQVLNTHLTFRSAVDVDQVRLHGAAQAMGPGGTVFYPVISAAYTLLKEAGRPNVYLEGQHNLLSYINGEESLRALMEFFSDEEAVKACISPKSERTTILLGDDLPGYPMPGYCVMSKRYLAGGGLTGAIGIVGPVRMPYREMIPRLEYFALMLGQCMSGKGGRSASGAQ